MKYSCQSFYFGLFEPFYSSFYGIFAQDPSVRTPPTVPALAAQGRPQDPRVPALLRTDAAQAPLLASRAGGLMPVTALGAGAYVLWKAGQHPPPVVQDRPTASSRRQRLIRSSNNGQSTRPRPKDFQAPRFGLDACEPI